MKSKIWIFEWEFDLKILQEDSSKASCFSTSSFDKRESKTQKAQAASQAIDVAVVCAFKQFKESTFKTISRASTCESFILRIAFLYSWCNHTKTWKLHDKNANKRDSAAHRTNWVESWHVESISSWDVSERESIEILNHDEQILNARRVASFNSIEWDRDYFFVLNEINRKSQISVRFFRVEQITQKWRSFVARFSSALRHKKSLSSKHKDEIICYNCDKQNHVRSKCLISFSKINFKYAKKDRSL
jgi:hypothetical protein